MKTGEYNDNSRVFQIHFDKLNTVAKILSEVVS